MKYIINYEATLGFEIENEKFEISLEQPPGVMLNGSSLVQKFTDILTEKRIEFDTQDIPKIIAKSIKTNVLNFKVNDEVFFTMDSSLSPNRSTTITRYEDKERTINSQDHNSAIKLAQEMLGQFKNKLEEKIGRELTEQEAVHFMANGGILEE